MLLLILTRELFKQELKMTHERMLIILCLCLILQRNNADILGLAKSNFLFLL